MSLICHSSDVTVSGGESLSHMYMFVGLFCVSWDSKYLLLESVGQFLGELVIAVC